MHCFGIGILVIFSVFLCKTSAFLTISEKTEITKITARAQKTVETLVRKIPENTLTSFEYYVLFMIMCANADVPNPLEESAKKSDGSISAKELSEALTKIYGGVQRDLNYAKRAIEEIRSSLKNSGNTVYDVTGDPKLTPANIRDFCVLLVSEKNQNDKNLVQQFLGNPMVEEVEKTVVMEGFKKPVEKIVANFKKPELHSSLDNDATLLIVFTSADAQRLSGTEGKMTSTDLTDWWVVQSQQAEEAKVKSAEIFEEMLNLVTMTYGGPAKSTWTNGVLTQANVKEFQLLYKMKDGGLKTKKQNILARLMCMNPTGIA